MRLALCLLAAAIPALAQPKLLVNARPDTRPAAAGLARAFDELVGAQTAPGWIAYSVPASRNQRLGCELVNPSSGPLGVVHLEPPEEMVVLFRVENGALVRVRGLSPFCEIDAGGLPFHWLTGVNPAESTALLARLVKQDPKPEIRRQALSTLGAAADPQAAAFLLDFLVK